MPKLFLSQDCNINVLNTMKVYIHPTGIAEYDVEYIRSIFSVIQCIQGMCTLFKIELTRTPKLSNVHIQMVLSLKGFTADPADMPAFVTVRQVVFAQGTGTAE